MNHAPNKVRDSHRFYEARPQPWLISLFRGSVHHLLSRPLGFQLNMDPADVQKLQALNKQPEGFILSPNHSSIADAFTLQELGYKTGIHPATMTSLDSFDRKILKLPYQVIWPLLSRFGHFSVNPGNNSVKQSVKHAEALLEKGDTPLCIFPEGRFTWNNQGLSPCRNGTMRIAIQAAKDGKKPVKVVPIGIYYNYSDKAKGRVEQMLSRQEQALAKQTGQPLPKLPDNATPRQRMDRLQDVFLNQQEKKYGLPKADGQPERIYAIQERSLKSLLSKYNARYSETGEPFQQIRYLSQAIHQQQMKYRKPARLRDWLNPWSKPWKTYKAQSKETRTDLCTLKDLEVLLHHKASLQQAPSPTKNDLNRQLETLSRLNCLILGQHPDIRSVVRHCTAHIKVGEPITVTGRPEREGERFIDRANQLTEEFQTKLRQAIRQASDVKATPGAD